MDALLGIYGRSRRERSVTPIPSLSPPPQSPEPRGPRRLHEIKTAEEEDRAIMILPHLTPIMSPTDLEDNRCIICLDPLPGPTDDGDAAAVQLVCRHGYCRDCIMPWLLELPNDCCPYCRRKIWEEPLTVHDDSDSEMSSSTDGEEDDGDTVMGDDDGEEGEDHDEEEVADSGDEMDEDDHDSALVGPSEGDEGEDDVQLGTMYVGGLRRSARYRGN